MLEKYIIQQIVGYLNFKGVFFWRNNTGAVKAAYTRKRGPLMGRTFFRFMRFGIPGMSDFIAIIKGVPVFIEAKAPGGKQSPAQKEFQQKVIDAGGQYWLIFKIEDMDVYYNTYFKLQTNEIH